MDGIQPYAAPTRPPAVPSFPANPAAAKTPSDYVRALRRRVWLVLMGGVPLSVAAAVWAVRQPSVYRASAEIMIEPPQYDPVLSTLVSHEIGGRDPEFNATYVPNRGAMLKSRSLVETAFNDPALALPTGAGEEAVAEVLNNLQYRQIAQQSRRFQVWLEGTDPARTARLLYTLLELFQKQARSETELKNEASKSGAETSRNTLKKELAALDTKIYG